MSVVTLEGRGASRGARAVGGGNLKGVNSLLAGETVVGVEEDFTHAWCMLELSPSKMFVGVTLSDPVSSQMPLQPPTLQCLEGYKLKRLSVNTDRQVVFETDVPQRQLFARVASAKSLDPHLAQRIAAFLHPYFSATLRPLLARPVPYPVALLFVSSPQRPDIEGKGTLFQPQKAEWSAVCPLPLPRPITAYAPPQKPPSAGEDRKCLIQ